MPSKKAAFAMLSVLVVSSMILTACPQAEPQVVEKVIKETVEVVVEKPVEVQKIVEVTTQVEVEKVVTATPEPQPAEPELPAVVPDFKNPDTYTVITGSGEAETLDPAYTYEVQGGAVENNIYEGLVWYDRESTDNFIPALATSWTVDEAGTEWVFQIREGVKFHEGGTLEPHDVAYTAYRAMLQGRIDGPQGLAYEALLGPDLAMASIKYMAAAYAGKENFEDLTPEELVQVCETIKSRVVADDEAGTVTYHLFRPTPWFMSLLAQTFMGAILDMEWMLEIGDWDNDCANWTPFADPQAQDTLLFDRANGTGPYKLDHWTPGEEMVLVANEDYWRTEPMWEGGPSGPASIKRVVFKNITEWGTRLAMFEAGDADHIYVPATYRPQLEPYVQTWCDQSETCSEGNASGYVLSYRDLPGGLMTPAQLNWNINMEGGNPYTGSGALDGNGIPFDFFSDIHIRKAFSYCFDYQAMIRDALAGQGVQALGPIPPSMELGYIAGQEPVFAYDLAKCEEEFKLADVDHDGIPAGEDDDDVWSRGFYFQLTYNTGNEMRRVSSEILKAGIESISPSFSMAVVGMPWPVMLASRRQAKLPIYVGGWQEDFHDAHNWAHPFMHSQGSYGRVINMSPEIAAEFDALVEQGAALTAFEERRPVYEEIQRKAQDLAVNVWLYQEVQRFHFQPWIKGFYYNPAYSQAPYSWIYALSKVAP